VAINAIITDTLPASLDFVSATGLSSYNSGNNTVTWNMGVLPGLVNQNYNATMGGVTLVARVKTDAVPGRFFNARTYHAWAGWAALRLISQMRYQLS